MSEEILCECGRTHRVHAIVPPEPNETVEARAFLAQRNVSDPRNPNVSHLPSSIAWVWGWNSACEAIANNEPEVTPSRSVGPSD